MRYSPDGGRKGAIHHENTTYSLAGTTARSSLASRAGCLRRAGSELCFGHLRVRRRRCPGDGSLTNPYGSLPDAVAAVRALRKAGSTEPVVIKLREGRHQLNRTLVLGIGDGSPATSDEVTLEQYGAGDTTGPAFLTFAYTKTGSVRTLHFPEGALKNWSNLEDVEIQVRPSRAWVINMLPLASVDEADGVAATGVSATYQMGPLPPYLHDPEDSVVWVENILEALDEPGEWVVNTETRKIYLWPSDPAPDG